MNHETSEKIREIEAALYTSLIVLESSHDDLDGLRTALSCTCQKLNGLYEDLEKIAAPELVNTVDMLEGGEA